MPERPAPISRRAAIALAVSLSAILLVFMTAAALEDRSAESVQTVSEAPPLTPSGDALPGQAIVIRLMAPDDGCWRATIDEEVRDGCGGLTLPLQVQDEINVVFERTPPAAWTWCAVLETDGKVVLTRGPDSNPDYRMEIFYEVPEPPGYPPEYVIEPVTC